jgi:hypothetical protein
VAVAAALVVVIAGAAFLVLRQDGGDTTAADSADLAATTTVAGASDVPAMAPSAESDASESTTAGAASGQGSSDLGAYATTAELRDALGGANSERSAQDQGAGDPGATSAPAAPTEVDGDALGCVPQLRALGAEPAGTASVAGRAVVVGRAGDGTWVVLEPPSCTALP